MQAPGCAIALSRFWRYRQLHYFSKIWKKSWRYRQLHLRLRVCRFLQQAPTNRVYLVCAVWRSQRVPPSVREKGWWIAPNWLGQKGLHSLRPPTVHKRACRRRQLDRVSPRPWTSSWTIPALCSMLSACLSCQWAFPSVTVPTSNMLRQRRRRSPCSISHRPPQQNNCMRALQIRSQNLHAFAASNESPFAYSIMKLNTPKWEIWVFSTLLDYKFWYCFYTSSWSLLQYWTGIDWSPLTLKPNILTMPFDRELNCKTYVYS